MKKLFLLLFTSSLLSCEPVLAQSFTISKEVVQKSLSASNQKSIIQSSSNQTVFSGFSLQMQFTQISYVDNNWFIGNSFTLGEAYLWHWADGKWNPDSSITVSPKLSLGFGVNFGISVQEGSPIYGTLPLGAIVLYSGLGIFAGYDLLNTVPVLGVTYSMPAFPFLKGATRIKKLPQ